MKKRHNFIALLSGFYTSCLIAAPAVPYSSGVTHHEILRVGSGLLLVVLIIVILSWIAKRLNLVNLSTSKGFQVIASMALTTKEKIMLVKVGNKYLLLGIGSGTVNHLYDFGEQVPEGFAEEEKASFADLLKLAARKS